MEKIETASPLFYSLVVEILTKRLTLVLTPPIGVSPKPPLNENKILRRRTGHCFQSINLFHQIKQDIKTRMREFYTKFKNSTK